jgi:hypothetical protein
MTSWRTSIKITTGENGDKNRDKIHFLSDLSFPEMASDIEMMQSRDQRNQQELSAFQTLPLKGSLERKVIF